MSSDSDQEIETVQAEPRGKRRQAKIRAIDIHSLFASKCCSLDCLQHVTMQTLKHTRDHYASLTDEDLRRHLIWESVKHGHSVSHPGQRSTFLAKLSIPPYNAVYLCCNGLARATGAGISRIQFQMKAFLEGQQSKTDNSAAVLQTQPCQNSHPAQKQPAEHMLAYMHHFVDTHACLDPTSKKRHMSSPFSIQLLYNEYLNDPDTSSFFVDESTHFEPMSKSKMHRLWKKCFSDVVLSHHTRLGKCNTCFQLSSLKHKRDADSLLIRERISDHLNLVRDERVFYRTSRLDAKPNSGKLSIIFDGARDIGFPCLYPTPKMFADSERLLLPLYGHICHTYNTRSLYFSPPYLNHNPNYVMTTLALHLSELIQTHGASFPRQQLLLQADNTTSENKNCFIIAFCALLVLVDLFAEVQLTMLPVGHTHEDIDGIFGSFSHTLSSSFASCYTLDEIKDVASKNGKISFRPEQFQELHYSLDWKTFLCDTFDINHFRNIMQYHVFKIGKAANGEIQMVSILISTINCIFCKYLYLIQVYKDWQTRGDWHGSLADSSGIHIFNRTPSVICKPSLLPAPTSIEEKHISIIDTIITNLKNAQLDSPERVAWFKKFKHVPSIQYPNQITLLLSKLPRAPQEMCPAPVPPYNPSILLAQRLITAHPLHIPHPTQTTPTLDINSYRKRSLLPSDLVAVIKNPQDDKQFPNDKFWIAKVVYF